MGGRPDRIEARFLISAPTLQQCPPPDVGEIAIVGRSNSGKSSVINQLTRNRQLARTSKTPGRTQLLNFFATTLGGRLVDLPGYGYARVPKPQRRFWSDNIEDYLNRRSNLTALVLVMDIRHTFESYDEVTLEWARQSMLPTLVLLNKADKLKRGAALAALRDARTRLSASIYTVQLFSARNGCGRDEAIEVLAGWLVAAAAQ
jgi:GTP-binding protein